MDENKHGQTNRVTVHEKGCCSCASHSFFDRSKCTVIHFSGAYNYFFPWGTSSLFLWSGVKSPFTPNLPHVTLFRGLKLLFSQGDLYPLLVEGVKISFYTQPSTRNHFSLMPTTVLSGIYRLVEKSRVANSHELPSGIWQHAPGNFWK